MNNISLLARLKQSVDTARHARASMQSRRRDRARWLGDRASIFRPSSRSDQEVSGKIGCREKIALSDGAVTRPPEDS
jgi:hypothetical protein